MTESLLWLGALAVLIGIALIAYVVATLMEKNR